MQVPETLTSIEREQRATRIAQTAGFAIERARIAAYGHFRDADFQPLAPGINLFFGHNEAGKTTLFSFFYSMLFGIYPTSPDSHPYYPRDARHLLGELWYTYGGRSVRVERKLMSAATGKMDVDGQQQSLGQSSLPEVDFLSKEVFASVFALNLDDLVAPSRSKVWSDIQDGLLGGMNMDFLRSGRAVAGELEAEAGKIWRSEKRGNQSLRDLEKERNDLGREIREAKKRNEEIRALVNAIADHGTRLEELRTRKDAVAARLAKLRRLLPASIALKRLNEWQKEAGDVSRYAGLPADPLEALDRLEPEIEEISGDVRKKEVAIEECIRAQSAVTDADRAVVETAADIQQWGRIRGNIESWQTRILEIEQEVAAAHARRDAEAERIFSSGWTDDVAPLLERTSTADLRAALKAYVVAKQTADDARREAERENQNQRERETTPWLAGVLAVLVTAIAAAALGQYFAAVIVLLAAVYFGVRFDEARRHNRRLQAEDRSAGVAKGEREAEQLRRVVVRLLGDLPLPTQAIETPEHQLASDIETMKRLAEDAAKHQKPLSELQRRLAATEAELRQFATGLGLEFTGIYTTIDALLTMLESASDRVRRADGAARRQRELEAELSELRAKCEKHTIERTSLVATLEEIAGSAAEGAAALVARRNAASLAERDARDLRNTYGSIEEVSAEVQQARDADPELFEDGTDARLENAQDQLSHEIEDVVAAKTAAEKDLEKLEKLPSLQHLESEDERLAERVDEQKRERDRLAVLARIIRLADDRFRRRHQPDVIRRASVYFSRLTGGRYEGMILEDEKLFLIPSGDGSGIELVEDHNWTSRGTRDQIFLAIRLALIDHLDAHHARLPVFLDEVFVNWDRHRRRSGLELLRSMADQRQVFLFTCHEWFRDEVEDVLAPNIITL